MKVLLANPPCKKEINRHYEKYFVRAGSRWPHSGIKRKNQLPHYLPFPFFLAYTAALLLREGFHVEVIDAVALDIGAEQFKEMAENIKPDILLFETTTPTIEYDINLIKEIRKRMKTVIVLAGTHATTFGPDLIRQIKEIDYILLGEYELTFLKLARQVKAGRLPRGLPGLIYRRNGELVNTGRASPIEPLDLLPSPARELFPSKENSNVRIYWDGFCQNWPAVQIHASRGCPYRCSFCVWNQVIYANGKYRTFSPSRVADEMEEVINKYGAREIYFDDDDFTINKKQVLAICQQIKERKLKTKWSCMGDAINLDRETVQVMASSGCIGIKFGVESGSPQILRNLGKPLELEKVRQLDRWCNRYGIKTHATFAIGLLGESKESLRQTYNFAKDLKVSSIQVSICTPFPGTRFFQEVTEGGFFRNLQWEHFDGKEKQTLSYPGLNAEDMERFRKRMLRNWFLHKALNPFWLLRQMRNLIRTIKGLGFRLFIRQAITVLEDECR